MYEELYEKLTDEQAENYLRRINYEGDLSLTRDTLDKLIFAHQCSVPFENLDIFDFHKPISLAPSVIYKKVVEEHRGGYCFELNLLFYSLLSNMGFEVIPTTVRLKMGRDIFPPNLHRASLVKIDGLWHYADVGLGAPHPRKSVLLKEGYSDDTGINSFDVVRDGDYWMIRKTDNGGKIPWIMVTETMSDAVDFLTVNFYCSHSPDVRFTTVRLLNLNTPDGYYSLTDELFTILKDGVKTERELSSKEEINEVLKDYFKIYAQL